MDLRFRARIAGAGWKGKAVGWIGRWVYLLGAKALLAGLTERVGKEHGE